MTLNTRMLFGGLIVVLSLGVAPTAFSQAPTSCHSQMHIPNGARVRAPDGTNARMPTGGTVTITRDVRVGGRVYCEFSIAGQTWRVRPSDCVANASNISRAVEDVERVTRAVAAAGRPQTGFASTLASEGWQTAGECIPTSNSYRARHGTRTICDRSRSGWSCLRGVRYAIADALGRPRESISLGLHAENAGPSLEALGFRRLSPCTARSAPMGAVLVYQGSGSGHAEIKSRNPSNNGVYYCSDYCSTVPRDEAATNRTLRGCYVR